jgi:PAS domain S-box-containing protein
MKTERLFENRKDYQALVQSVSDYVIAVNREYQIIMANDLFNHEFGEGPGALCFKSWKKREEKCTDCLVEKSFHDGLVHSDVKTVRKKDGVMARMLIKSTPVKNEQGEILYVLETATDITERELLRKSLSGAAVNLEEMVAGRLRDLEKSEKKYRTIFERSRDAIILIDPRGQIVEVNRAGLDILGYQSIEAFPEGKSAADLFENGDDFSCLQRDISRTGFVIEFETQLRGKQARAFDALITANVMLDTMGQVTGYVMIIRDITQRKKAQLKLERRTQRLATLDAISTAVSSSIDLGQVLHGTIDKILEILESDSVRIYLLHRENQVLNLAAYKGLSERFITKDEFQSRKVGDGLLGETVLTGKAMAVDNVMRSRDPYVDAMIEEGLQSTVYIPLLSKGEAVGVMSVSSHSKFRFSPDYVEFLTAIGNQIGVAIENASLYETIKKAYQELKEAQEQVIRAEKLASLGKLAATIAHEINNPLAAVLTYVKLMLKLLNRNGLTQDRAEDILRYLATMESETARCGEIVKNLLAFSRQSEMTIGTHRIEDIIDRTLILIAHDLEINEIGVVKDMEPALPEVQCDFKQIQQAFLNLMSNAREAMTKGGTLSVRARCSEDHDFLEVVISDTGCGIAQEDLKNIFEPFFTTKEEGKGVGLGLSVVYGIITRHSGSIGVESEPGKGARFTVRLPIAQ